MIYLPFWMMENMHLNEGDIVHLKSATIQKGSFVKLQPQTTDFIKISNPKAVLEQVTPLAPPRAPAVVSSTRPTLSRRAARSRCATSRR